MKFSSPLAAMLALAFSLALVATPSQSQPHRFLEALAANYRDNQATHYNASLRSFYGMVRTMDSAAVLDQIAALHSFCGDHVCDGLQPVALALADRLASFEEVSPATARAVLSPIFELPLKLNEASPNFAIAVGNSHSFAVRSLRPEATRALFEIYGRRLADAPSFKISMDSILTFSDLSQELCDIESHSDQVGGTSLSDKEARRAELCESMASSGGSAGGPGIAGALIDTVSVDACADVTIPPHSVDATQLTSLTMECLAPGSGRSLSDSELAKRLTDPDRGPSYDVRDNFDGTSSVLTFGPGGLEIARQTVPTEEADAILQGKIDRARAVRTHLAAAIRDGGGLAGEIGLDPGCGSACPEEVMPQLDPGCGSGCPEVKLMAAGARPRSTLSATSSGDSSTHASAAAVVQGQEIAPQLDPGCGSGCPEDDSGPSDTDTTPEIPPTDTSNTAPDKSDLDRPSAGFDEFRVDLQNPACQQMLHVFYGGKVQTNILELAKDQLKPVVNPHPDGPFPWDESGSIGASCGEVDVQNGRGARCNLPIMCAEGQSLDEDCRCTSSSRNTLTALVRSLDETQECRSLYCDPDGVCACSGEALPGNVVVPKNPLFGGGAHSPRN